MDLCGLKAYPCGQYATAGSLRTAAGPMGSDSSGLRKLNFIIVQKLESKCLYTATELFFMYI